ncbi:MAG: phosphatase PAP2 family protein [Polyangia bacterium]
MAPTRSSGLRRALSTIGPNFTLATFFVLGLFVVVLTYGGSIRYKEGPIILSLGIMMGILILRVIWGVPALLRGTPAAAAELRAAMLRTIYDWGPLIIVVWMFESLGAYTGIIRADTVYDQQMYDADVWLCGIEPSLWMGKHLFSPLLVDWFSVTYGLYFITPMVLATILSLRGRRGDFTEMVTAVVIQMGFGFILHLFVPVGPPRFFAPLMSQFEPTHLHSLTGLMEMQQGVFDTAHQMKTRASFPSLHCSLGIMTLLYANRYSAGVFPRRPRLFFYIVCVLVPSLWLSTIYLRHHWLPDIAAGLVLGVTSVYLATKLRKIWPHDGGANA